MECNICGAWGNKIFTNIILKKYEVDYYQCPHCGLIYTETPYWLEEAYREAITVYDTGIMQRNEDLSIDTINILIKIFGKKNVSGLDWGGGYGIFVRIIRDCGFDFRWMDKYSPCLVARGFEVGEIEGKKFDIITAFELFEHFESPRDEMAKMLKHTDIILFSTLLYGSGLHFPAKDEWWYYASEGGQHVAFYSEMTLNELGRLFDMYYYRINDSLHIFSKDKLPIRAIKQRINSLPGKVLSLLLWEWRRTRAFAMKDMEWLKEKG